MSTSSLTNSGCTAPIPVIEHYWSLVERADKKFSKIRDLPYYERNRFDTYFHKVFKVYTQLWKFQQENREKLVEGGLKRWEIGEIASRIGQLYFGQYMRTSEVNYLTESYVFYEAILNREYFKDGLFQDLNLANKQLRFLARFLMVCLLLNRREMVHQLVKQLKMLVDDCKRTFQESEFKEWKIVVQEIFRFLKADTSFMNMRPLRYSVVLDPHPDSLSQNASCTRSLKLRDAILCSYHHNEVKLSELTLDAFRMLQCLEWEPSGSFFQEAGLKVSQNGTPGPSRISYSQDLTDITLPPNPRKAVLYRPSVTHFMALLATMSEELPLDGILLVYLSTSARGGQALSTPLGLGIGVDNTDSIIRNFQYHNIKYGGNHGSPYSFSSDNRNTSTRQSDGDCRSNFTGGLQLGSRGTSGINCIYPCDLSPFTRRPLFLIIDSDRSEAFKIIKGQERGEPAAILLSPSCSVPNVSESGRHSYGSLFTIFLTAPLQAFCQLLGCSTSEIDMDMYNKAEELLSSSINEWGTLLATSDTLDMVWAQILHDPFLRRLLLRFIFCRAVLTLYAPTFSKKEYLPDCLPCLPDSHLPGSTTCQTVVFRLSSLFSAANNFVFSDAIKT
uniref:Protein SCAI n=1 Tax=Kalanchoe fedtschenkoi TaxID=63787 RepID=A0A7N0TIP3_KALFE